MTKGEATKGGAVLDESVIPAPLGNREVTAGTAPAAQIVPCGNCGRPLSRNPRGDGKQDETTEVYSRTLVGGEFLPSCSRECHGGLRARIGLPCRP